MTNEQIELLWNTLKKQNNSVNLPLTTFLGYNKKTDIGTVLALFDANGYPVITLNEIGFIAFDHTVFYALPLAGVKFLIAFLKLNIKCQLTKQEN
ncbi:alanyl-tRNA synthetase [Spiroplasma kunkelii CR2-3x]|uniref:Alanyl-tRNA synthetase n=1 Tax=Spiroplasma kunkelii CR2-3x TaxID=273035 RepID=A0A0K2JHA5_SPIKU|nr:hypothetical protein [Spiroplasma kunkelii]ALA97980.1 alanyl-tRNA synthetase [Spiroplasma kunkelii CR2-3x]